MWPQPCDIAINQITRQYDDIAIEAIGSINYTLHKIFFDSGPDMQVSNLGQTKALKLRGQVGNIDFNLDHMGCASGIKKTDHSGNEANSNNDKDAIALKQETCLRSKARPEISHPKAQQRHISQQSQNKYPRK